MNLATIATTEKPINFKPEDNGVLGVMSLNLMVTIGLLTLLYFMLRWLIKSKGHWLKNARIAGSEAPRIQSVHSIRLSTRSNLHLVQVEKVQVLVAETNGSITLHQVVPVESYKSGATE